jgi:enoyl-[acyl-carrier protein] reductase I
VYPINLTGKTAVVFGIANHRSIAWAIAKILHQAGVRLAITYQNQRLRKGIERLTTDWSNTLLVECDVSSDDNIEAAFATIAKEFEHLNIIIHSIAFANRDDLKGQFMDTGRDGFRLALEISAYSLVPIARYGFPLLKQDGGSILTLTSQGSSRVLPNYNVMGTAKAALESIVRQLAHDLGLENIRVNAISAGPIDTLSSRVISGFAEIKKAYIDRSPMKRNITTEEIAKTALYLCSDLSSGVTGQVIHVDAGYRIMAM